MTLEYFFCENPSIALAFSGGVDSSYLLYAAQKFGAKVKAYFVKTAFQPDFELKDAFRLAEYVGADLTIIEVDILSNETVVSNPTDRCFYCKTAIITAIKKQALADGFTLIIDGTNASDSYSDRPGMKALGELSVVSPLRECGLTKHDIRILSEKAGLFTWNKPAYACLATRIPTGCTITRDLLQRIEGAEDALFSLGFSDFRVRVAGEAAKIQLLTEQIEAAVQKREEIVKSLKNYFPQVLLDLEGR